MTVLILPSARDDLSEGFDFYERQDEGPGDYFQESLFSDIESLRLCAGIHAKRFGYYRLLSKRFPYAAYYDLEWQRPGCGLSWIADGIRRRFARNLRACERGK